MSRRNATTPHEDGCVCLDCIANGLALWEEHKPQTADDWVEVAIRCAADPEFDHTQSEPVFGAAVLLARKLRARG